MDALKVTVPPGLGRAGVNVARATGVAFASTVTLWVIATATPSESVTWSPIVLAPAVGNEVVAVVPVASSYWPSPSRSQAYEPAVSVLSSVVVAAFTDTWSPTSGLVGVMTKAGWGGVLASVTLTEAVVESLTPPASVTRRRTVLVPAVL